GDQRAAARGRLDDENAEGKPGDDAIAAREVVRHRRHAGRELRHQQSLRGDLVRELAMLRRVDAIQSGAAHGDRIAAGIERTAMRGAVDALCQSAGDDEPRLGEDRSELARVVETFRRRGASEDDRDLRPAEQRDAALAEQRERSLRDYLERRWIALVLDADEMPIRSTEPGDVALDRFGVWLAQAWMQRARQADPFPRRRPGAQCLQRSVEFLEKLPAPRRPDAWRPQQREPGAKVLRFVSGHRGCEAAISSFRPDAACRPCPARGSGAWLP